MKRILVAVDGSEGAARAVRFAADLAKNFGAELLIINVIGGYGLPGGIFRAFTESESAWFAEILRANSGKILETAREQAVATGAEVAQLESRSGNVTQSILAFALEKDVDVIVVGKRGESEIDGFPLGSVSQKLASLAHIAVTVVP